MLKNLRDKKIILASKSPRRQELLKGLDLDFEIKTLDVDESYPAKITPIEIPEFLANKKAAAFQDQLAENVILITADTIVIQDQTVLEKPSSTEEAIAMVTKLSDQSHTVVTGVCIQSTDKRVVFRDETKVYFNSLSTAEIEYYIENYQPFDKAGSYGVQEWIGYVGIERLEGSYYNVMGLPVHKVYQTLKSF